MNNPVKEYTSDQIAEARKMCQLIQSIPEPRRHMCVAMMIAYMDGIEVGMAYAKDGEMAS